MSTALLDNKNISASRILSPLIYPDVLEGQALTTPGYRLRSSAGVILGYSPIELLDLRWDMLRWQRTMWSETGNILAPPRVVVQKVPRRSGKTHGNIFNGVSYLYHVPLQRPIGAYYAPNKDQTIRNTWKIFEMALKNVPGAKMDKTNGVITYPRPTIKDPGDYVTIYFFGVTGGSGTKRGGYYDLVNFDEVEYISETFIEEVGFISGLGRPIVVILTGTPDGVGTLDHYIDKAKKKEALAHQLRNGVKIPKKDIPADVFDWRSVVWTSENIGVYSRSQLDKLREMIGEERYEKEMNCNDKGHQEAFYYKAVMNEAWEQGRINSSMKPEPHVPVHFFYDLGVGSKSDRAAIGAFQLLPTKIKALWATDMGNASYADMAQEIAESPVMKSGLKIAEHVLPHDAQRRSQGTKEWRWEQFERAIQEAQIPGEVRTLSRTKDLTSATSLTRDAIRRTEFHEINCDPCILALEKHRKKKDKTHGIYLNESAKTKYRDLADMYRTMAECYFAGDYEQNLSRVGNSGTLEGRGHVSVGCGGHPMEGTIIDSWNTNSNASGGPDYFEPMI